MDKLARQLREDANRIDCEVSPELDDRIRASLEAIQPEVAPDRTPESKSFSLWWLSSLTGVAAAIVIIVLMNLQTTPVSQPVTEPPLQANLLPSLDLDAQPASLVAPLEAEFENLQADLKKAEQAVKQDIDRLF